MSRFQNLVDGGSEMNNALAGRMERAQRLMERLRQIDPDRSPLSVQERSCGGHRGNDRF
jgi:hypothetical protein